MTLNRGYAYESHLGERVAGTTLLEHLARTYRRASREEWAARIARGEVAHDHYVFANVRVFHCLTDFSPASCSATLVRSTFRARPVRYTLIVPILEDRVLFAPHQYVFGHPARLATHGVHLGERVQQSERCARHPGDFHRSRPR